MLPLPPRLTFNQKWRYGFYDHIFENIKRGLKKIIYVFFALFLLGALTEVGPSVFKIIIGFSKMVFELGRDIFS